MLIKEFQFLENIKKQKNSHPPLLLYGPNEGLIRDNCSKIKKLFNKSNAEEVNFIGKSICEEPEKLIDEIQTISMFSDQKIITIENPIDKNIELFEDAFTSLNENILIIVIANNLSKGSKIRKFFEGSKIYLACPHYEDDFKSKSRQIHDLEKKINKVLNQDIKTYLSQNLSSDRMISINEIDKIKLLYSNNNRSPELQDVKLIFNDNTDTGLNNISQNTLSGQTGKLIINLNKIFSEGVSPITVIRSLLSYVERIQKTQIALKRNNNFDEAIKTLKPPIFWKDKDIFQLHCKKWPIKDTINNFNILLDAELSCKSNYTLTNIHCERALLKIASKGKIYFR